MDFLQMTFIKQIPIAYIYFEKRHWMKPDELEDNYYLVKKTKKTLEFFTDYSELLKHNIVYLLLILIL